MTYGTHDVSAIALLIDCVAHGLGVDCETFIFFAIGFIPFL
jgi:hypothetical protein